MCGDARQLTLKIIDETATKIMGRLISAAAWLDRRTTTPSWHIGLAETSTENTVALSTLKRDHITALSRGTRPTKADDHNGPACATGLRFGQTSTTSLRRPRADQQDTPPPYRQIAVNAVRPSPKAWPSTPQSCRSCTRPLPNRLFTVRPCRPCEVIS